MLNPSLPPDNRADTTPQLGNHAADHNLLTKAVAAMLNGPHLVQSYADRAAMLADTDAPLGTVGRYGVGVNAVVAVKTAAGPPAVWEPLLHPYRAWAPQLRRASDDGVIGGAGITAAGWELSSGGVLNAWGTWSTTSSIGTSGTQVELVLPFATRGIAAGTPIGTFAANAAGWNNTWRSGVVLWQATGRARLRGAGVAGFVTDTDVAGTGTSFVFQLAYPVQTAERWI